MINVTKRGGVMVSAPAAAGIKVLYAWIAIEPDGSEWVVNTMQRWHREPLIGPDLDKLRLFRVDAERAHEFTGCTVVLRSFGIGDVIDRVGPIRPPV